MGCGIEPRKIRKLVAVFAADVEGYSRLMGADEVGTLKGLTGWRAILGRMGDGAAGVRKPPRQESGNGGCLRL